MSEQYADRKPTEPELNATYRDITYDAFCELTDEELAKLRAEALERVFGGADDDREVDDNVFWQGWDEGRVFQQFLRWKQYGKPDRDVTEGELAEQITAMVQRRQQDNPNYGVLPSEKYKDLTEQQLSAIYYLLEYFREQRSLGEPMCIDDYSLYSTLGLAEGDVEWLEDCGALQHIGLGPMAGNVYALQEPYLARLLATQVADRQGGVA